MSHLTKGEDKICGIVGIAGDITPDLRKVFADLLVVDQLRGSHSTGVFSVRNYDETNKIVKVVGGPENFADSKKYQDIITDYSRVLLGHNRYATSGKVNVLNAHPFEFDNVVGVHNGSLRNYTRLPGHGEFPVDSQVLYHSINEQGLQETLDNITGAYALVWWDRETKMMNFLRNAERPLFFAYTNDQKAIIWASEAWMIEGCANRHGIVMDEVWSLKTDTLVQVDLSGTVRGKVNLKITQDMKGGAAVPPAAPFRQQTYFPGKNSASNTGGATSTESSPTGSNVVLIGEGKTDSKGEKTTQETSTSGESLIGKGLQEFTAGFKGCDFNGARYAVLTRKDDTTSYRLYLSRCDFGKILSGDKIRGEVRSLIMEGDGKMIYKISHSSYSNLSAVERAEKAATEKLEDTSTNVLTLRVEQLEQALGSLPEEEEATGELYEDGRGKFYDEKSFVKKYSFCSYCTGNITPNLGFRFIKDEILCDECLSNPIIVDSLY